MVLSIAAVSGTVELPAKFVQVVLGSHLKDLTCELVELSQPQTSKMLPLCARTAEG